MASKLVWLVLLRYHLSQSAALAGAVFTLRTGHEIEAIGTNFISSRQGQAAAGVEPANKGFADLCLTTWLRRHGGAENGIRTRDPQLGKLLLYQLSYFRSRPTIS